MLISIETLKIFQGGGESSEIIMFILNYLFRSSGIR